ncbi:MAG TPA: aminoglycoside phosphotransferase family protein [Dehalococcoidia bacterium]|jgi:aminoglycoside phosphotransferase (APT) family kinase protein|nr:aminoglycoside phosphotransferase family protein [Dehalococcoidia bacterium]
MPTQPRTVSELKKIAEGREAEMFAWEGGKILRLMRNPDGEYSNQLQAVALESARGSGVRVPAVHGQMTVNGRPGLVMERIDGTDYLTLIGKQPWRVYSIGSLSGAVHARLHEAAAPGSLPSLRERLRRNITSAAELPDDLREFALRALEKLPDGDRLCHGDFHPGNILETKEGPIVIDWTNATCGDPDADFARTLLMIRIGDPPPGAPIVIRIGAKFARNLLLWAYSRAYRRVRPVDKRAAARWDVPIAAARIAEGIEVEFPKLLRFLKEAAAFSAASE